MKIILLLYHLIWGFGSLSLRDWSLQLLIMYFLIISFQFFSNDVIARISWLKDFFVILTSYHWTFLLPITITHSYGQLTNTCLSLWYSPFGHAYCIGQEEKNLKKQPHSTQLIWPNGHISPPLTIHHGSQQYPESILSAITSRWPVLGMGEWSRLLPTGFGWMHSSVTAFPATASLPPRQNHWYNERPRSHNWHIFST